MFFNPQINKYLSAAFLPVIKIKSCIKSLKHTWQELVPCTVQGVTTICGKLTTIIVIYGPVKHYLGSTYLVILHRLQANLKQICSFSWSEKCFLIFISNILTKPFKNKLANLWKKIVKVAGISSSSILWNCFLLVHCYWQTIDRLDKGTLLSAPSCYLTFLGQEG